MPHVLDPVSGIIIAANNRIVGDDYPHHITHNWRVPYRARRIHNLLKAREKLTIADFFAIQGDTYSYPDAIFAAEVVRIGQPLAKESNEWRELVDALTGWDGYSNSESTVLPIITQMRATFRRHILESVLGTELEKLFEWRNEATFIDRLIVERPSDWLPDGFTSYESLILECYRETRASLAERLGADSESGRGEGSNQYAFRIRSKDWNRSVLHSRSMRFRKTLAVLCRRLMQEPEFRCASSLTLVIGQ